MKLTCALTLILLCVASDVFAGGGGWGRAYCSVDDELRKVARDLIDDADTASRDDEKMGYLRVPVAIHLMDVHGRTTVSEFWKAPKIRSYFGVRDSTPSGPSVNVIWAQAKIRFEVKVVERCTYSPAPPALTADGKVRPPEPAYMRADSREDQQQRIDAYLDVNKTYGAPGMLNVYFWSNIVLAPNGYGESPRRNRVEVALQRLDALPTVWIESGLASCAFESGLGCRLIIAHELGHGLGLKHTCRVCTEECCKPLCLQMGEYFYDCGGRTCCAPRGHYTYCDPTGPPPVGSNVCCCGCEPGEEVTEAGNICGDVFGCCKDIFVSQRLMYPDITAPQAGESLCDGEVHSARSAVREFFYLEMGGARWRWKRFP